MAESVALCSLCIIAMLFERVHHWLFHISDISLGVDMVYADEIEQYNIGGHGSSAHGNDHGQQHNDHGEHDDSHSHGVDSGHVMGAQAHFEGLLNRVNGEFMVLGFLAFCVWSFNQAKGFDDLAKDVITTAPDGNTLLHLWEAVHMYVRHSCSLLCCA